MQAVITGDIVNSTSLEAANEKKLMKLLQDVLITYKFEFYRGDSFQAFQNNASEALKTALLCRTAAVSLSEDKINIFTDVRISIGIAPAKLPLKKISTAKGEAFVLSGRAFDQIAKTTKRLVIVTKNPLANEGLAILADYIDDIFEGMTGKQATVIFGLLKGQTQQTVAGKLKKSKSTIHQLVNSGRWAEIEKLLQQYQNIIKHLS